MNGMNKVASSHSKYTSRHLSSASAALRQLFGWMESRYGGNIPIEQHPKVITVPGHRHSNHQNSDTSRNSNSNSNSINSSSSDKPILNTEDLVRLMQHDPGVVAIHVQEFYPKETAIRIGKQLIQEAEHGNNAARNWNISTNRGIESSDVTTIGAYPPYNIVVASSRGGDWHQQQRNEDEYFAGVQREHYQRRRCCRQTSQSSASGGGDAPFLWPLDLLRLQLDEAWPSGAGLARRYSASASSISSSHTTKQQLPIVNQNPPYGGGLPRIMYGPTRYTKGFVHVDEMGPLQRQNGLFSANIYLQLPDQKDRVNDENGPSDDPNVPQEVLEIWPTRIMNRWDWYRNMLLLSCLSSTNIQDQIRLRHELGCAPVRIAVSPGDLVLFCVQRPHAAMGFQSGTRVSLQCFLQHQGIQQRLLIDS